MTVDVARWLGGTGIVSLGWAEPSVETTGPHLRIQGHHCRPHRSLLQIVQGVPPFPHHPLTYRGAGYSIMHGADVKRWQRRARKKGYLLRVDGWYGPRSQKVAQALQNRAGLVPDGVVGPRTWLATWQ